MSRSVHRAKTNPEILVVMTLDSIATYTNVQRTALPVNWNTTRTTLNKMKTDHGVQLFTSAGNGAKRSQSVDTLPAKFIESEDAAERPVVVSALDPKGFRAQFSQHSGAGDWNFYAPRVDVLCASKTGRKKTKNTGGTSYAAPIVCDSGPIRYDKDADTFINRGWCLCILCGIGSSILHDRRGVEKD